MVGGNQMSYDRAFFTAVNAATLTGFQQSIGVDEYLAPGQIMVLLLTLGGSVLSLMIGALAVVRIVRLPYSDRRVILAAMVYPLVAILIGASLLVSQERDTFAAIFQAASAFGNSGVSIGKLSGLLDWRTHFILMPLALLGGLGLPVLMEIFDRIRGRGKFSFHSRIVLSMTGGIYLFALFIFILLQQMELPFEEVGHEQPSRTREVVLSSSAAAINSRTAGLPLAPLSAVPRAMQWTMLVLMLIGASPAGTGGGLKTTTLFILCRGVRQVLAARAVNRIFGIAAIWLVSYLMICFLTLILLLWTAPQMPADRLLFLTVSAVSNVGLSHDPVSLTRSSLFILSAAMLLGRMIPLLILWWTASTTRDADVAVA